MCVVTGELPGAVHCAGRAARHSLRAALLSADACAAVCGGQQVIVRYCAYLGL